MRGQVPCVHTSDTFAFKESEVDKDFDLIYNLQLISIDKHQSKKENTYSQGRKFFIYLKKTTSHNKQKTPTKTLTSHFAM